jgi:hypothetical protein
MRNILDRNSRENRTHILFLITVFENRVVYEIHNVKTYIGARQATDDNKAHAPCLLDN